VQAGVMKVTNGKQFSLSTPKENYTADFLVLATGVSSNNPLPSSFGYRGPATEIMVQDEVLRPETWPADEVKVYLKKPEGVFFGVLTPKGRCLNVSLLGKGLTQDAVTRFIDSVDMGSESSEPAGLCGCAPRIAVRPAKHFFGDGWVAVGDAAVTRLYKDGIGSAFFTAKTAMKVAISDGISRQSFARGYLPYCKTIAADNMYGRLLFRLWEITLKSPYLLEGWKRAVRHEMNLPHEQRIHMRILWGMLTGDELYKDLALLFFKRPAVRGLWIGLTQAA
jgi:flavin-dependent dehydrogenase